MALHTSVEVFFQNSSLIHKLKLTSMNLVFIQIRTTYFRFVEECSVLLKICPLQFLLVQIPSIDWFFKHGCYYFVWKSGRYSSSIKTCSDNSFIIVYLLNTNKINHSDLGFNDDFCLVAPSVGFGMHSSPGAMRCVRGES